MLLMKAWLETRWRLVFALVWACLPLVSHYLSHSSSPAAARGLLALLGLLLAMGSIVLAGSGVKSQAPVGFPEGLAGSTQFTISLPVSRLRLLAVRAAIGLLELSALIVVVGCITWSLFPAARGSAGPADLARLLLVSGLFLTGPYFASVLFSALLDEPLYGMCAVLTMTLLFVLSHYVPAAVDIFGVWGQASPLITHKLPWPQMAVSAGLAVALFLAAVRVVQRREY